MNSGQDYSKTGKRYHPRDVRNSGNHKINIKNDKYREK
jgi:hypothetical protein